MVSQVTRITSKTPDTLTKTYSINADGTLNKTTVANLTEGNCEVLELHTPFQFAALLEELQANQALCFGRPAANKNGMLSKAEHAKRGLPQGYITRTKDCLNWPTGGGVLVLDYDPSKGGEALTRQQLFNALYEAVPLLNGVATVWWPSASSHICNGEHDLTGLRGQRIYIMLKQASDIPRAGTLIADMFWLAGYGYYDVSKAGALLERCPVDTSVWQTNRLDFAAGANCVAPLEQRRGKPLVLAGEPLDSKLLLDLTDEQQAKLATIKQQAKALAAPKAEATKQQFIKTKATEMTGHTEGAEFEHACATVTRAVNGAVLCGDYPVMLDDGVTVTVADMLKDPSTFHGRLTYDPLEPDYDGGRIVGKAYLIGGRPNLYSQAHGGKSYRLIKEPRRIEVVSGRIADAVDQTLALMTSLGEAFNFAGQLVTVANGKVQIMNSAKLGYWLGGHVQYVRINDRGEERNIDPPPRLVETLLGLGSSRNLHELRGVITAPTITETGFIVKRSGYCHRTKLFLDMSEEMPYIPDEPTKQQVINAVNVLMMPFLDFPFVGASDCAAILGSLLTAVVRPVLPTAIGFAFDAPTQGSGKTLLARCVGILAGGVDPNVTPHTAGGDEEIRKRILSLLVQGDDVIVWDNVLGVFDSAALAALLTSPNYQDRKLGASELISVPNKALFIMTGNNITFVGDMPRRILKCRIDPQTDQPFAREFAINPIAYCLEHRAAMNAAAITIIRGYQHHIKQGLTQPAAGRMASFELWDQLVRQPIHWLNKQVTPDKYADLMDVVREAQANDPEQEALYDLLVTLRDKMPPEFTSSDLWRKIEREYVNKPIAEAIEALAHKPIKNAKQIGNQLMYRVGRIVGGLSLEAYQDSHRKVKVFRIKAKFNSSENNKAA